MGGAALVLGASGFLGPHVLRAALEAGAERALAVSRGGQPPGLPADGVEELRLDLGDDAALEALFERARPAWVLNAAAAARALDCERDPARARALNVELPARLGRLCAARGLRLVHVSTDLVYGRDPAPPGGFREEHPPAPLGVYGETKAAGERALLERAPRALVARLPLLFGASFGRGLGASDALLAQLARGETPALFEDEHRTPLDVEDAARALVELASTGLAGLLHVAGPERVSRVELGLAVLRAAGVEAPRARLRVARRADHPGPPRAADVSLDATRARAVLRAPLRGVAAALAARPRGD